MSNLVTVYAQNNIAVSAAGIQGANGHGVPLGGIAGQVLQKIDGTDYNTQWSNVSASATSIPLTGYVSSAGIVAATDNVLQGIQKLNGNTAQNLSAQDLLYFGNGADGNVTISNGTTTLTRDMYYYNLTLSGTGKIATAGFRIFVAGILDISAAPADAISRAGTNAGNASGTNSATGGSAGAAVASNVIGGGLVGAVGGTGVIGVGVTGGTGSGVLCNGGAAGASGSGGTGTSGSGGAAGGASAPSSALPIILPEYHLQRGVTLLLGGGSGRAGSSGAGDGTNAGGGGGGSGAGAGIVYLAARAINRGVSTASGCISANGGTGGAGGSPATGNVGGGGGGSGGGGGWIYLIYRLLTGAMATNACAADGGAGGNGGVGHGTGTSGGGAASGQGGRITLICVDTGIATDNFTGNSNAASGATGASAFTYRVSL